MIKRLKYIFIPVLAVFLMSHNVSAFQITESVQSRVNVTKPYWTYNVNNGWYAGVNEVTRTSSDSDIIGIRLAGFSNSKINVYQGEYIVMHGWVSFSQLVYSNNFINIAGYIGIADTSNSTNCAIISLDSLRQQYFDVTGNERYNFDVTCKVLSDNNLPNLNFYIKSNVSGISGTDPVLTFDITGWDVYVVSDSNKEAEEKTQEAADNSSTAGDSSTSDSESATSSLLSVIGTGIGAITSATATNCRINGNMGNLDVGTIDLCANPVPSFVAVIGSIIAVLVVLPLVILLFNRFIGIIRSFQT